MRLRDEEIKNVAAQKCSFLFTSLPN